MKPTDADRKAVADLLAKGDLSAGCLERFRADARASEQKRLASAMRAAADGEGLEHVFSVLLEWADTADKG